MPSPEKSPWGALMQGPEIAIFLINRKRKINAIRKPCSAGYMAWPIMEKKSRKEPAAPHYRCNKLTGQPMEGLIKIWLTAHGRKRNLNMPMFVFVIGLYTKHLDEIKNNRS